MTLQLTLPHFLVAMHLGCWNSTQKSRVTLFPPNTKLMNYEPFLNYSKVYNLLRNSALLFFLNVFLFWATLTLFPMISQLSRLASITRRSTLSYKPFLINRLYLYILTTLEAPLCLHTVEETAYQSQPPPSTKATEDFNGPARKKSVGDNFYLKVKKNM